MAFLSLIGAATGLILALLRLPNTDLPVDVKIDREDARLGEFHPAPAGVSRGAIGHAAEVTVQYLHCGVTQIMWACGKAYIVFSEFDALVFGANDAFGKGVRAVVYATAFILLCWGFGLGVRVKGWFRRCTVRKVPEMTLSREANLMPESARDGSAETAHLPPKHQGILGSLLDDGFRAAGACHRFQVGMDNFLVVPDHVVAHAATYGKMVAVRGKNDTKEFDSTQDRVEVCTDVVAYKLSDSFFSSIGLPVTSLRGLDRGQLVQVVGVLGQGTQGFLRHAAQSFGYMEYDGTTKPGYSGAGYYSGNGLMGIHLMGGDKNLGVSASYVYTLLKSALRVRDEATEDWLKKLKEDGDDYRVDHTGEDEVRIFTRGLYHTVPKADYYTFLSAKKGKPDRTYADVQAEEVLENADFRNLPPHGASQRLVGSKPSKRGVNHFLAMMPKDPAKQHAYMLEAREELKKRSYAIPGQMQRPGTSS